MDLRLLPGLAERGQVLAGVAVEQQLVGDPAWAISATAQMTTTKETR
jgi:hypothetical protein